ncbi:MAG TPA: hypothetical protein VJH94_05060 [Candidatus Paceibacterota bacterium]
MNKVLRQKAIELRVKSEKSYSAIKRILGVSKSTLSYWLKDYPLSSEKIYELRLKGWQKGEVSRELYRATMRSKREVAEQSVFKSEYRKLGRISDKSLFIAGLMLYLAEGAKHKASSIVLANTDYRTIRFFIKWLERFLEIPREKLRVQLHLYETMVAEKERRFWQKSLGLTKSQFYKSSIRPLKKGSFSYQESFRHGTCSLYAFGEQKRTTLMMAIQAFMKRSEEWVMRV